MAAEGAHAETSPEPSSLLLQNRKKVYVYEAEQTVSGLDHDLDEKSRTVSGLDHNLDGVETTI